MSKQTYSEKLKDPRWQKKRLEIFERDGWKCSLCGDDRSTLVVHHWEYVSGRQPWEYDSELTALCESCHETEHGKRAVAEANLLSVLKKKKIPSQWIDFFAQLIEEASVDAVNASCDILKNHNKKGENL